MRTTQHIDLNAPPERIWEFITALQYLPVWMMDIARISEISTPTAQAGTTFTLTRPRGRRPETWIVADWEAPKHLRLVEIRRKIEMSFDLDRSNQGSSLRITLMRPAEWGILDRLLLAAGQQQTLARSLEQLKELIALNQDIKILHGMGDE